MTLNETFNLDVYNEAYHSTHHHSSHHNSNRSFGPQFDSQGNWFHDGILTRWNGKELEDLYLQPNGRMISCGFLIKDTNTGKYLGCHATGRKDRYLDLPKGCLKVGDNELDTAIRELEEETGIKLSGNEDIKDLGKHESRPEKDLHIYYIEMPIDIDTLHCDSTFVDKYTGKEKPEMDYFELVDDISSYAKGIIRALKDAL